MVCERPNGRCKVTCPRSSRFAAYLHLPHPTGEKSGGTSTSSGGLVVDYNSAGRAFGTEVTAPQVVSLERLNLSLAERGETPMAEQDYKPVRAA